MAANTIARIQRALQAAMEECVTGDHRPVCLLTAGAERALLQPFAYGG